MPEVPEVSAARRGLDALLEKYPDAEMASATNEEGVIRAALREALHPGGGHIFEFDMHGPWSCVDLYFHGHEAPKDDESATDTSTGVIRRFAIWNSTGSVYSIDSEGHHSDNPIIELIS